MPEDKIFNNMATWQVREDHLLADHSSDHMAHNHNGQGVTDLPVHLHQASTTSTPPETAGPSVPRIYGRPCVTS